MCNFSEKEKRIVDLFFQIEYPWRGILAEQIANANHRPEEFENTYHINFSVHTSCKEITNVPRVPLSIVLEFGCTDKNVEILFNSKGVLFSSCTPSPMACNIHIRDGYLKVIEVFTLDGTPLCLENICDAKKYYLFYKNSSNNG